MSVKEIKAKVDGKPERKIAGNARAAFFDHKLKYKVYKSHLQLKLSVKLNFILFPMIHMCHVISTYFSFIAFFSLADGVVVIIFAYPTLIRVE